MTGMTCDLPKKRECPFLHSLEQPAKEGRGGCKDKGNGPGTLRDGFGVMTTARSQQEEGARRRKGQQAKGEPLTKPGRTEKDLVGSWWGMVTFHAEVD